MDKIGFLLKTPYMSSKKVGKLDVNYIDIFYSDDNLRIWYESWVSRSKDINKFANSESIEWTNIEITMNIIFKVIGRLPLYTWSDFQKDWWEICNKEVMDFIGDQIEKGVMDVSMSSYFIEFKKQYSCIRKWILLAFVEYEEEPYNYDFGMFFMKEVLMGNYLTEPFEITVSKKTRWGNVTEQKEKIPIHNNYVGKNEMQYTYKGKKYTTPLFGLYTPSLWDQSFADLPRLPSWSRFQKAQYKIMFESWENNYILACWWLGKSVILLWMAKNYVLWDKSTPWEMSDGKVCHYYGITHESNKPSVMKVAKMVNNMFTSPDVVIKSEVLKLSKSWGWSGTDLLCYKSPDDAKQKKVHGIIQFLSWESAEPWRGWRPTEIIVDEFLKVNQSIKKLIGRHSGNKFVRKWYISTANEDSKSNTLYLDMQKAEREYATVKRTMHDIVFEERHRVWLDKCKSMEEFKALEPEILEARKRIMTERPFVWLRFDIRDIEFESEEDKNHRIEVALKSEWVDFVLHEFFSIVPWDKSEFPTEGMIVESVPDKFDYIIHAIDIANVFDKPALTKLGVLWDCVYIYDSLSLPVGEKEQKIAANDEKYKDYERLIDPNKGWVFQSVDTSGNARSDVRENWIQRWVNADFWIYNTPGMSSEIEYSKDWFLMCGKTPMVKIAQGYFKSRRIFISNACAWEEWLIDQLSKFKKVGNTYKAVEGKDDKVMAMLMGILVAHKEWLQLKSAAVDRKEMEYRGIGYLDRLALEEQKKLQTIESQDDGEDLDDIMYWMR